MQDSVSRARTPVRGLELRDLPRLHRFADPAGQVLPEVLVAVEEDARGRGVGGALMAALAERAAARGWAGLALTVSPRNPAALALYRHAGFRDVTAVEDEPIPGLRVMARAFDRFTTLRGCSGASGQRPW